MGACQRRADAVFPDLADGSALDDVRERLVALFDGGLRLPRHCVVDVALEPRTAWLVDVNVASSATDPVLFRWDELLALRVVDAAAPRPATGDFELRVVDGEQGLQPAELSSFRAPLDVTAIAEAGGLEEMMRRARDEASTSEDDDDDG